MPPAAKKTALLIGNDRYQDVRLQPLVVPGEDVRALKAVLADPAIGGFDVVQELYNADRNGVAGEIERLFKQAARDDLVLLYFSGHGILDALGRLSLALAETNVDLPVTTALRAEDLRDLMETARCRRQVLILDCCYSGAFARAAKDGGPVPAVTPETFSSQGEGRVALLSSTATQRSFEGERVQGETQRSVFTHWLVEGLSTGEAAAGEGFVTEEALFQYAYDRVRAVGADMTPQRWVGRQHGRLVIARNPYPPALVPVARPEDLLPADMLADLASANPRTRLGSVHDLAGLLSDPERGGAVRTVLAGQLAAERDYQVRALIERVLKAEAPDDPGPVVPPPEVPEGPKRHWGSLWLAGGLLVAVVMVVDLGRVAGLIRIPPEPVAPASEACVKDKPLSTCRDTLKDRSLGPEMVVLSAGSFTMGSPTGEPARGTDEKQHQVQIAQPFAIGKHEVTFDEYDRFAKATWRKLPQDSWGRKDQPVINATWADATAYAAWFADHTGKPYRLPTEAEWEYAARAGTATPFWTGDCIKTDQANYNGGDYNGCGAGESRGQTVPVGSLPANPWGLHEVAGNVWEWTCSVYADSYGGQEQRCDGNNETKNDARRVLRGGSWFYGPWFLRSAYRSSLPANVGVDNVGFRLARTL
ncbi:SUMF1/EgtB/PvdO family nonheme iron enzyme [uncultured Thiodictyon sp.]|uniref:caspase, EACC1-associated type n=1 Tax=uncultured Thiodictyon sp. TaxID=1846217 RepID=UPI0025EE12BE|nr:SUMF1/EgtB/PvdO family nonheme iron enzyme [uncultured Thiodictyon sp.]